MAPRSRSSLISQLADFSNVAPEDKDPLADDGMDADGHRSGSEQGDDTDGEGEDEHRARTHYVDVGPSRLRHKADVSESDVLRTGRYAGQRASAKEMMGLGSDDEEDEEGETDRSQGDEERSEDRSEDGEDDLLNGEDGDSQTGSEEEDEEEDEDEDLEEEDEDKDDEEALEYERKEVQRENAVNGKTPRTAAQSDKELLKSLRQRNEEDARRGRDVRRQLDAWGNVLGLRIRAQKVIRAGGRLQPFLATASAERLPVDAQQSRETALESLHEISQRLFSVQRELLKSLQKTTDEDLDTEAIEIIDEHLSGGKRKRQDEAVDTLRKVDEAAWPLTRDILDKWSLRSSLEGHAGAARRSNKFDTGGLKAMNQRATDQIDALLSGEGMDRLRKRTRVWRGTDAEGRLVGSQGQQEGEADDEADEGIFDDSDFYQALLRELIDTKAGDGGASDPSYAWADAVKKASKKNKNVDTRASKGRRLRYEVHEKVQNFMPPIPRETWTDEQIDRLVLQLRGEGQEVPSEQAAPRAEVDLQNFKLFG